jgi:hypothetical protein
MTRHLAHCQPCRRHALAAHGTAELVEPAAGSLAAA